MIRGLNELRERVFFTSEDVSAVTGIKQQSAWVLCSRYVKTGRFIRLKNNFYVLDESWRAMTKEKLFELANFLQVPSYISFLTALSYYEVTTQVTRDFFESASLKRTAGFERLGREFEFYKIKKEYYFGFERKEGFFIASKEKAFADAVYLCSFGKYALDTNAIDKTKIDLKELKAIMKRFPERTRVLAEKICRNL